jgi:CO/xanthine dehydrogenase FAD-binding subunit
VDVLTPRSLDDALRLKSEHPDALPIQGGTDVMVALNFDRSRPETVLNLNELGELRGHRCEDGSLRLGAGVTYTDLEHGELRELLPALAEAARTVGSPQIRNRGTIGGNLGTASPAGDAHPPLLAAGADVELSSSRGTRMVPIDQFFIGPKRNVLEPDELIAAVRIPLPSGPEQFSKIGTRNAMVIAVAAFSLALHPDRYQVGTGIGSAGPTPRRAWQAEKFLADALAEAGLWESRAQVPDAVAAEFGRLVAAAAEPIDDVRGTAAYRRHCLSVMARRTLAWAWQDYQLDKEA